MAGSSSIDQERSTGLVREEAEEAIVFGEHPGDSARRRIDAKEVVEDLEVRFRALGEAGRRVVGFSAGTVEVGGNYSPFDPWKLGGRTPVRSMTRFVLEHVPADPADGPLPDDVRVMMVRGSYRGDAARWPRSDAEAQDDLDTTRADLAESGRQIIGECEGVGFVGGDFADSDWAKLHRTRIQQITAHYIVHAAGVTAPEAPAGA